MPAVVLTRKVFSVTMNLDLVPRSTTCFLSEVYKEGGTRLKFRLEAFYNLSLETSGLECTPFIVYTRGGLDNLHVELVPSKGVISPGLYFNFTDPSDRAFAFDYDGTGQLDHLIFFTPAKKLFLSVGMKVISGR